MKSDRKISALIVDDEPLAREGLRSIVSKDKSFIVCGEADDGENAVQTVLHKKPDVLFLDIQMPEMDGFEVLAALPQQKIPVVVFVTAYDEFAIKAFQSNALDYILKPLDPERVHAALSRIKEMIRLKRRAGYSDSVADVIKLLQPQKKYPDRLTIRSTGKIVFVHVDDIRWIESDADYIHIHTPDRKYIVRETMNSMSLKLDPSRFARVHRSYIVKVDFIKELQRMHHGDFVALLKNGKTISISRRYKKNLPHAAE
ncbi:MAG: response regulator transcription factor [Ignavibacteriales bacterium]|nr:response regulator transcription factor [Ignavibacteriales bacterium]